MSDEPHEVEVLPLRRPAWGNEVEAEAETLGRGEGR